MKFFTNLEGLANEIPSKTVKTYGSDRQKIIKLFKFDINKILKFLTKTKRITVWKL